MLQLTNSIASVNNMSQCVQYATYSHTMTDL